MLNLKKINSKYINMILVLVLIVFPFIGTNTYHLRVLIMVFIYSILALGLNIITGYTGQLSLGNAGFFAIGAYASAILTKEGIPFIAAFLIAGVIAGIFGFLLGLPTLRLSGTYLAITTLGFGEIIRMILLNWDSVTNGPLGISRIPRPSILGYQLTLPNNGIYYFALIITLLVLLGNYTLINSKIGRAFISIREDELAATFMGVNTFNYKILAFVLSSFLSGIAGSLYAHLLGYIDPITFTFDTSIMIVSIVILGGMGSLKGMFIGAFLLVTFPEALRFLSEYRFLVYGAILVLMMRFRPQGICGGQNKNSFNLLKGSNKIENFKKEGVKNAIFRSWKFN